MDNLYIIYGLRLKGQKRSQYIGLTTRGAILRLQSHFLDSVKTSGNNNANRPVCNWIKKYGKENIELVTLEICPTGDIEYLNYAEKYWIKSFLEMGYVLKNVSTGGKGSKGVKYTEEQKIAASIRSKNFFKENGHKPVYDFWVEKYGVEEANRLREEKRKKASASISGSGNPMYGRTGENAPAFGRTGEKHPMYGKHQSDNAKQQMSEKLLGRPKPPAMGIRLSFTQHNKKHIIKKKNCKWCNGASLENEIQIKEKEFNANKDARLG